MLQGRLVELAMCLLSQGHPLLKDIVSKFAKKYQEGKVLRPWFLTFLRTCNS